MNMINQHFENSDNNDALRIHLDFSGGFLSEKNVLKTDFLTFFRKFQFGNGPIISVKSVAQYVGEFGIFLNAKCRGKPIGVGIHPEWIHDDGKIVGIESLTYVIMTVQEMKTMIQIRKDRGETKFKICPPDDEIVMMDEFDFEFFETKGFAEMPL